MALVFVGKESVPNYTCLSTDISDNSIDGAIIIGATVFVTDTAVWKIIKPDLTLADYNLPVKLITGDIELGAVEIKDGSTDNRAIVNAANTARSTSTVVIPVQLVDAAGGVSLVGLNAGEAHVGAIGGNSVVVTMTPTLTTHANYVSGDYVGTDAAPISFAGCARVANGTGVIQSAILIDYALQSVSAELWLFDATITAPSDSAAWTISDADALKCIGVISFSTYYASAANSVSPANNLGIAFKCTGGTQVLYGCLVTRGAPTYASGDISIRLTILQD